MFHATKYYSTFSIIIMVMLTKLIATIWMFRMSGLYKTIQLVCINITCIQKWVCISFESFLWSEYHYNVKEFVVAHDGFRLYSKKFSYESVFRLVLELCPFLSIATWVYSLAIVIKCMYTQWLHGGLLAVSIGRKCVLYTHCTKA